MRDDTPLLSKDKTNSSQASSNRAIPPASQVNGGPPVVVRPSPAPPPISSMAGAAPAHTAAPVALAYLRKRSLLSLQNDALYLRMKVGAVGEYDTGYCCNVMSHDVVVHVNFSRLRYMSHDVVSMNFYVLCGAPLCMPFCHATICLSEAVLTISLAILYGILCLCVCMHV